MTTELLHVRTKFLLKGNEKRNVRLAYYPVKYAAADALLCCFVALVTGWKQGT